jgi:microcystin synthetase protein McyA
LACYLPDGNIKLLGRIDHQIKIRGIRIEPAEIEAALLKHTQVREALIVAREAKLGKTSLVAYVTGHSQEIDVADLRRILSHKLPSVMMPAVFMVLDAMPLNPNGKIDRNLLPEPQESDSHSAYEAPRNAVEKQLCTIWQDLLGTQRVGVNDNFFALGGDSILSIQVIARAKQAGIQLTPKQLFQYQSIGELAVVVQQAPALCAEQHAVNGPLLPTPIQQRFFQQGLAEAHHFNQAVLLQTPPAVNELWARQATVKLWQHHDALRLRCQRSNGAWQLEQLPPEAHTDALFNAVDLAHLTRDAQREALQTIAAEQQRNLNLQTGPLLQVTLFTFDADTPARLLFVIHHLAVDAVSWRILLDDWYNVYTQLSHQQTAALPLKSTSFKTWSERINAYAQTTQCLATQDHWLAAQHQAPPSLPVDLPLEAQHNTVGSAAQVAMSLEAAQTRSLLEEVPQVYNTKINDVLLTALGKTLVPWCGRSGVLIDLEGHGREDLFDDVDVSRTVGWFTSLYPVLLELISGDTGEQLKSVKEQLRRIPRNGIDYGVLRYLNHDSAISRDISAQISFNYLGQFDNVLAHIPGFSLAEESPGPACSPKGRRSHLLEVEAQVIHGRLEVRWIFSQQCHKRNTVEALANAFMENLNAIISHCLSPQAGGFTPSDFPLAGLNDKKLEKIANLLNPVTQ